MKANTGLQMALNACEDSKIDLEKEYFSEESNKKVSVNIWVLVQNLKIFCQKQSISILSLSGVRC